MEIFHIEEEYLTNQQVQSFHRLSIKFNAERMATKKWGWNLSTCKNYDGSSKRRCFTGSEKARGWIGGQNQHEGQRIRTVDS